MRTSFSKFLMVACIWLFGPAATSAEPVTYPRLVLERSAYSAPPDEVADFIAVIKKAHQRGEFAQGPSKTEISGMSAKAWLIAQVSPAFECMRDFGGMCAAACIDYDGGPCPEGWECQGAFACQVEDQATAVRSFIRTFGQSFEDVAEAYRPGLGAAELDHLLEPVSFDMSDFTRGFTQGDGMYCTPDLWLRDAEAFENAMANFDDELMAFYSYIGVLGSWNVRAEPTVRSDVIGRASYEALLFPDGPETTLPDQSGATSPHSWRRVNLPDGQIGFIATPLEKLVFSDLWGGACVDTSNGRVTISAHVGGGD